jgi:hypothetical protein
MSASRGIRTGAVIGTVGGALRAAGSFAPTLIASDDARTWLYVGIDICLALGLSSLYLARRQGMRVAGTLGSLLALGGLIAGRIGPVMTDLDLYPVTVQRVPVLDRADDVVVGAEMKERHARGLQCVKHVLRRKGRVSW